MAKKKGSSSWLVIIAVLVTAVLAWYSFSKVNSSIKYIGESGSEGVTESVATLQTATPIEEPVATPTVPVPTKVKSPEELSLEIAPIYKNDETGLVYDRFYADGYVWYVDSNNTAVKVWDPETNEDTSFEITGKQGFRLLDGTFVTMEYSPSITIPKGGPDIEGKPSFKSWEEASQYIVNVRGARYTDSFLEKVLSDPETAEDATARIAVVRSVSATSGHNTHKSFRERFVRTENGEEIYVRAFVYPNFLVLAFVTDDSDGQWVFDFATIAMTELEFNEKYDCIAGQNGNMTLWKQMVLPNRVEIPEN